jgi:hypothetical protein
MPMTGQGHSAHQYFQMDGYAFNIPDPGFSPFYHPLL